MLELTFPKVGINLVYLSYFADVGHLIVLHGEIRNNLGLAETGGKWGVQAVDVVAIKHFNCFSPPQSEVIPRILSTRAGGIWTNLVYFIRSYLLAMQPMFSIGSENIIQRK